MSTKVADIQYTVFLESIPQPVIITDLKGIVKACNKTAEKLFQRKSQEIVDFGMDRFVPDSENKSIPDQNTFKQYDGKTIDLTRADGTTCKVIVSYTDILNNNSEPSLVMISFRELSTENKGCKQLEAFSEMLAGLGNNYIENISSITALCGTLLGATNAVYNRLENDHLHALGTWMTPPDFVQIAPSAGKICFDIIKSEKPGAIYINKLPETIYYTSDLNVQKYNLKAYIGHRIRCNGEPVGSLCVMYDYEYEFSKNDGYLLGLLALALEAEETSETLRKSKTRFHELFDFAVEGLIISSPNGIITASNKSVFKLTGYTEEELIGKSIDKALFTPESLNENPFNPDASQEIFQQISEREIRCKNNRLVKVEMLSRQLPDHTIQTSLFDLSARKQAELKLRQSESTYRGIINSLNDAIYILDKEGCFLDVNVAAEHLYGYEKEFFLGKNPGFLSAPGMNDMDLTIRYIADALNGSPIRFEFWGLRKDGSVFPKEVSLSQGMWFGQKVVLAIGREISERKQAEDQLKVNEEKYRLLVQYSSDPIFSFNPDETYRFVNDAFANQFGKTPEEIIGKTPFDLFSADEAEKRLRLVRQVFSTGEKGEIEVKVNTALGEEKYYLTLADPVKDSLNQILWVTCYSKEITQRKKSEEELRFKNEQLKASNAEKDKFFSIVAHDLRGPMNGFLGLTGIMAEDIETLSSFELKEIATTMRQSAVNIYRLIENLLEWSKMQRGTIKFEPQPLFLKSALTKSIELVRDTASKKEIELHINIPDHEVVFADVHMLETVVRNLLSNAIKFSFRKGSIEIFTAKESNNMLRIEVRDNGIGMGVDLMKKLFLLTENANRKGTEGEPSTGLGLILCKEFVEKLGGKIWVESREGEGSSFMFTLPKS